jgi:hypothetical protein
MFVDLIRNDIHMVFQTKIYNLKCLVGEDKFEEILSYNEVMQHIEKDDDDGETFWKYKWISGHEGPLNKNHSSWKGDKYNVKVEWENGEVSYEFLHMIAADDPVTCVIYAKDHGLLDTERWKRFRSLAKRAKKMLRMVNQSKLRSYKTCKKYMYSFEIGTESRFVTTIVLARIHKMDWDLLELLPRSCSYTFVSHGRYRTREVDPSPAWLHPATCCCREACRA